VNPLLDRIAAHDVLDIAITTPDVEDLFLRYYREDDSGATRVSFDTGASAGNHEEVRS
jgi:hypothetical protein